MSELQQNRYDQLLRRLGNLKGPGSKVSDVISELFPMIDVERVPAELLILAGTAIAFRGTNIAAAAGLENASQLHNPPGSGKVLTVTQVIVSLSTASTVNVTLAEPLLANSNGFGEFRDSRAAGDVPAAAVGNTRIETGESTQPGMSIRLVANESFVLRDDNAIAVLLPNDQLTIGTNAQGETLTVAYLWREREAEPSELNL